MRSCACPVRAGLLTLAFVFGVAGASIAGASIAGAQELQLDPQTLDPKALDAGAVKPAKARKAKAKAGAQETGGAQSGGKTPDRQFGELEGWSPGKAPPKTKEQESRSPSRNSGGVSVSPSGNMSVGVPF